jgi:predicted transcriptional regulator
VSTVNPIELTAEIVSAFVSNNSVPPGELSALIQTVHAAVTRLADGGESSAPPPVEAQTPAVSIRKSVTPDYLICLDDGKKFKSLKRRLAKIGLTPDQYRVRWSLPYDYPWSHPITPCRDRSWPKRSGWAKRNPSSPRATRPRA